mmetsp:Transcript_7649/g.11865  ORF Transcript_7649/g.11865 Transcript_7649/m.11865 type:complete len:163 (-) Transcript_7649:794-1282(-)|eukprot:CAMPEP_0170486012 /NCGR_PEP_ID=MMETSP0208-20121228/5144_1 /TAXON_ID=197538 /ORGANISM="Strombidium inclinatum, Strain S3" /LENGTH=162 /DNA_ID=CAMNT_0010759839 /DNA_START=43 /DNA_END=531 /DNA_ORIENTATION=+
MGENMMIREHIAPVKAINSHKPSLCIITSLNKGPSLPPNAQQQALESKTTSVVHYMFQQSARGTGFGTKNPSITDRQVSGFSHKNSIVTNSISPINLDHKVAATSNVQSIGIKSRVGKDQSRLELARLVKPSDPSRSSKMRIKDPLSIPNALGGQASKDASV